MENVNGKHKLIAPVILAAIVVGFFLVPGIRAAIGDMIQRLNNPLPKDFWYMGEHIDEDEHKND